MASKDLTGEKFGKLTVIEISGKRAHNRGLIWGCKCDCGEYCNVRGDHLKLGNTKSCGCLKKEVEKIWRSKTKEKHVENTALYQISAKRKANKNNTSGAKGVAWEKRRNKWCARISFKKKTIFLGYFPDMKDAINARLEAEEKYFKPMLDKYKVVNN